MKAKKINKRDIFVGAVFVASVCILGIKLLNSTSIQIFVGENNTSVAQIPGYFTHADAAIIVMTSLIIGVSGTYLLFSDTATTEKHAGKLVLEDRKKEWEEVSKKLTDNEQKIYETILKADGVITQSELVVKTQLPKSNVSRTLGLLESKDLVERKRRGMGNMILLK